MNKKLVKAMKEALKDSEVEGIEVIKERLEEVSAELPMESPIEEVKVEPAIPVDKEKFLSNLDRLLDFMYAAKKAKEQDESLNEFGEGLDKLVDSLAAKRKSIAEDSVYQGKDLFLVEPQVEVPVEFKQLSEKIVEITGKTNSDEQVGSLLAMKDSLMLLSEAKDANRKLEKSLSDKEEEIKQLKESLLNKDKDQLIESGIRSMKLKESQKDWAKTLSVAQLKGYLDTIDSSKVKKVQELKLSEQLIDSAPQEGFDIVLNDMDRVTIATLGITEAKYKEQKAKLGRK